MDYENWDKLEYKIPEGYCHRREHRAGAQGAHDVQGAHDIQGAHDVQGVPWHALQFFMGRPEASNASIILPTFL